MVMYATEPSVVTTTSLKMLQRFAGRAPCHIVELQNLIDMGEIVFAYVVDKVGFKMSEGRVGAIVVERTSLVRYDNQERAPRHEHPLPFAQGTKRIGHVLEDVGGEHEVVR